MSWNEIYADMVFTPNKDEFARYNIVKDALRALRDFNIGQSKDYDVLDALGILEERFGLSVLAPCSSFRRAIYIEDETAREQICFDAISSIETYLRQHNAIRG
tara:strand:+ start:210 stop:518 length:309 start_codon:yes stop_codon:yes gene_type:complete